MNFQTKVCLNCSDVTTSLADQSAMNEPAAPVPPGPSAQVRQIHSLRAGHGIASAAIYLSLTVRSSSPRIKGPSSSFSLSLSRV